MNTAAITIRRSTTDDMPSIMQVYTNAIAYMRRHGNHSQWTNGYPSAEVIQSDISSGNHYIGVDGEGKTAFVFTFIIGKDPTYGHIEGGRWLSDAPYGTIHRIASSGLYPDVLGHALNYCFMHTDNIRIDTHADNAPMLLALSRHQFVRCGVIRTHDGSPRTAFQKVKK